MVSIKKLFINNYKEKNCDKFSKLINLEKLSILNSPIENLQGLSELKNIKALRLGNLMKLTSLQGLQNLHKLEDLEIQRCKGIYAISEVFELKNLECLSLVDVGNIESIKGIEILTNLKVFLFYESTNVVDGDLTPITKLNSLKKISFQNRKHYSHRRENFEQFFT
jgi:Leucine-rich repeat (LRR) protein